MKPIALQLYTLREAAKQDFPGVLKAVAKIGYKGVEFAGLHGCDPKEISKLLDDLGLKVCSSHTPLPTKENIEMICETEKILGNSVIISGFGAEDFKTVDAVKSVAAKFAEAAELVRPYGMAFGFHNHWWEFDRVDGQLVYDILMAECGEAFSELDTYWCKWGKSDPAAIVKKYGSKIPYLHIKDGMLENTHPHTAVGSGKMDFRSIIDAADQEVLKWLVVELDSCESDMMEAVAESYRYLTENGLAEGNGGCCCCSECC